MPAVEFRVHDRNSGAYLTSLPNASDRQCQDVDNDTGTGGVTLGLGDGDLGYMAEGNIVRCYVDGTAAYSWVVGPMDQSTVTAEEEAGEERRISGRGTLGLWADGIVYPEMGGSGVTFPPLHERRVVDVRRFDFAAVGYDDSSWPAAVVVPPPPALVPLNGTPSGWPLESQDWIWSRGRTGDDHPAGHSYFRHTFSVGAATQSSIYITADNGFELFLDGELLLSEMRTPLLWAFSRSIQVDLLPGTHLIAIKAVNHAVANIPQNPAGVAVVVVALDTSGDPTSVITTTGAGWKCADYPLEPPGMTVGRILTNLYNEARARGALSGLILGFSPTHDSAGVAWPNAPDVALPVGDDYLQVLRKLCELYCDVAMDPASLRLDAWVSRGSARAVSFTIGTNITALSHKGGEQARTSAILGRFGDHWIERNGSGRRQESFLEMGSATSSAQAQRMSDAALAERSLPIITTTTSWEPTAGTVPWVHFRVGDTVSVPNAGGAMVSGRVKSISLNETEDDYDFVAEIGSVESDLLNRLQRMARKAGHGALDGNFANATASAGFEAASDPTGGYLTSATPDLSLNSLTDVASVWDSAPVAGDFLSWNPDLGMAGMWEPASVVQDVGTTVVPEQEFGLSSDPGISPFPASEGHTHGSPLPRHPQTGYPYVDFGSGAVLLGQAPGEHSPAFLSTEDLGAAMRTYLTSPTGAQGWGRANLDLIGNADGTATARFFNDYADGQYGAQGSPSEPFSLGLEGDFTFEPTPVTPPVSDTGAFPNARLYFDGPTRKLKLSEDGGAYRDIGSGADVQFGTTVVGEQGFNLTTIVGVLDKAARADHSHGAPLPRHPQVGHPYVDFGTTHGLISMGRSSTEHGPATIGTELLTGASRTFITSPIPATGGGRATISVIGKDNGNAIVHFYNDLADGQYGDAGSPASPFGIELVGDFTWFPIANTPPLSGTGETPNAKMYFDGATRKLKLSEDGSAYRDIGGGASVASAVVPETSFSLAADTGTSALASRVDHTHGSPLPRHPQSGFPFVDFSGAGLVLGRLSTEFHPAHIGTQDLTFAERLFLTSPMRSSSSGVAVVSLFGYTDGTAVVALYNDLDTNNAIGDPDTGAPAKPFGVELTGDLTFKSIANTPPVAPGGQARMYYDSGKIKLSENGGAYRDLSIALANTIIGETTFNGAAPSGGVAGTASRSDHTHGTPAPGAAGSFLVTNTAGTGAMWAATTEIYFDDANNRIGIGATAPQERLSVRDGVAGLIATFFGPVGGNSSIAVGADKTGTRSLMIGYNNSGDYGWLNVDSDAVGTGLVIDNGGNIGIRTTTPDRPLTVQQASALGDWLSFRDSGGATQWHISETVAGDLDFVETGIATGRLHLKAGGFVGVGTTSPDRPLTVQRATSAPDWLGFKDAAGTTQWHISESFAGALDFVETGVASARLFLEAGGNVGVGTSDPVYKLDVAGVFRNTGDVYLRRASGSVTDYMWFGEGYTGSLGMKVFRDVGGGAANHQAAGFMAKNNQLELFGAAHSNGYGMACADFTGLSDGTALVTVFNAYKTNNTYGSGTSRAITVSVVNGDIETSTVGKGYLVRSPNGTRYRITVNDLGAVTAAVA